MEAEPFHAELRQLFLQSDGTIDKLRIALEQFSIVLSESALKQLYIRMQWEIETDNEFTMAMGMDAYTMSSH